MADLKPTIAVNPRGPVSGSSVLLEGLDMAHLLKTDTGFHIV